MTLQEQIKNDLLVAIKKKDSVKIMILRVAIGEISRQPNKEVADDKVVRIIKSIIKDEKETLRFSLGKGITHLLLYQSVLKKYIPKEIGKEEIKQWIKENVDFSQFNNKMQAMGPIMKHFGSSVDGNEVKQILKEIGK